MRVALCVVCALLCLLGCEVTEGPELLTLSKMGPRTVSAGDRLEIAGEGFPEGRRAEVVFRGTLRRPASHPVEGAEIVVDGFAHSATELVLAIDDASAARFVGTAGAASHTTFHGDVRVIFPSRSVTAPAVMGTLRAVTLDVVPAARSPVADEREAMGRRLLAHLGAQVAPHGSPGPLTLSSVLPGSLADRAGLREGDAIASAAGVTVRAISDLALPRGTPALALWVRRPDVEGAFEVEIGLPGFLPPSPRDLGPAGVLLGVLAALFCLLWGPLPRVAAWVERGVLLASRAASVGRRTSPAEQILVWLSPPGEARVRGAVGAPLSSFIVTVAIFSVLGSGRALVSPEFDLAILYGASVVLLCVGRLVEGGVRARRSWSLGLGLWSVAQTLLLLLPGAVGIVALVFASESVGLMEIAREQGGSPWRWWGLTNPGLCMAAIGLLVTAVPMGVRATGPFAVLEGHGGPAFGAAGLFAHGCEWLHAWLTVALAVCLYFGAFQVPLASALWSPSLLLTALGHVLFVAKIWFVMLLVVACRALASRLGVEALLGLSLTRALPASLLALMGSVLWAEGAERLELGAATAGAFLFGVLLCATLYVLARIRSVASREPLSGSVNPWL